MYEITAMIKLPIEIQPFQIGRVTRLEWQGFNDLRIRENDE